MTQEYKDLQEVDDVALERAVAVAMHGGMFQEFAGGDLGGKVFRGEEVVVDAILFAGTRLAGGAGNGVGGEHVLFRTAAEGGLAAAGRAGYDKKGTKHSE